MELLHLAEAEVAVEAEAEAEEEEEEASPSDVAEETRRICGGRGLLLTKQSIDYKALWTEYLVVVSHHHPSLSTARIPVGLPAARNSTRPRQNSGERLRHLVRTLKRC